MWDYRSSLLSFTSHVLLNFPAFIVVGRMDGLCRRQLERKELRGKSDKAFFKAYTLSI